MKTKIMELRRKLDDVRREMQQINDLSIKEERDLSEQETARWGELKTLSGRLQGQLEREDAAAAGEGGAAGGAERSTLGIGMSEKEIRTYSLFRAISAAGANDWRGAGLEREASDAVAEKLGRQPRGFFVPVDWMAHPASGVEQRALNKTTDAEGGFLVPTTLQSGSFIEMLRNRLILDAAGATVLTDLVGEVDIPKQTGGATVYWIDPDSEDVTTSTQAVGQVQLRAKTVGAYTDIYRTMLKQASVDAEAFVRNDLIKALALGIDFGGLHGTGQNNQPTGVAATVGIGSVVGGDNGLAAAWSHIVGLETEVAIDNADLGSLAYITNAKVRGKLKQTPKVASTDSRMIWDDGDQPLNGYPALVTNQVKSNLTKGGSNGVCSAIFFGNWADLVIGQWGVLDILVNPYALQLKGGLRVSALQDVDIAVRHAQSFAAMLDALTA